MKLYGYWRSSSAWRVRIALALKGVAYENVPVHLVRGGGEQFHPEFAAFSPLSQVPVLEFEQGGKLERLTQSVAIVEYLDETIPEPPIMPRTPLERARCRELVELVNSGIQPLQNRHLLERVAQGGIDSRSFAQEFIARGLSALEAHVRASARDTLLGSTLTLADIYLVPQMYNARRFAVALEAFPTLVRIDAGLASHPAFAAAHPDRQPDAEAT
ncbi:MAG TPA: maleylacetoacetate isomerase [Polyangiaceae bacterium]|nr:maleylacetoacetate isomerase [Polyangiaceae bacterium]